MLKMFGGVLVNTDQIAQIENLPPTQNGTSRIRITLTGGQTIAEVGAQIERMEYQGSTIVPAPPGYNVIVSAQPGTGLWHPHSVLKMAA